MPNPSPVKRNRSICWTHPWGWTGTVEASFFFVEKQVASFEKNLRYFFLQEWNGTDIKILIYIFFFFYFFFGGGVELFIVWRLSKHISDKIRFELVGDGW